MKSSKKDLLEELNEYLTVTLGKMSRELHRNTVFRHMNLTHLNTLHLLDTCENIRMKDIWEYLAIKPGSATSLVDRLIKENLVERFQCPEDRRVINIRLSDKGKAVIGELKEVHLRAWDKILEKLEAEDCETLLNLSKKLYSILCDRM